MYSSLGTISEKGASNGGVGPSPGVLTPLESGKPSTPDISAAWLAETMLQGTLLHSSTIALNSGWKAAASSWWYFGRVFMSRSWRGATWYVRLSAESIGAQPCYVSLGERPWSWRKFNQRATSSGDKCYAPRAYWSWRESISCREDIHRSWVP